MPEGWWKVNIVRFFHFHAGGGDPLWFDPVLERIDLAELERSDALIDRLARSRSPFDWLIRHESWGTKITVSIAIEHNQFALAQVACALERYRLAHGTYPEDLSALVPQYLELAPHDVVDGAPLRYERTGAGRFSLHSIGLSGVDGHAWPRKPVITLWTGQEGYWSWPQPAGR